MWIAPAVPALFAHNVPPWASSLTQAAALVGWVGVAELIGIGSRFDLARSASVTSHLSVYAWVHA